MFETCQYYEYSEEDEEEDPLDSSHFSDDLPPIRISTAPARPLTELEEFKRSNEFLYLEQAVVRSSHLLQKSDQKYDLDTDEGQKECRRFLKLLERLNEVFGATLSSRSYRNDFSKAYKVLYKEGSVCYLTEILDSAQEKFPYLYVNGEKFDFSEEVLQEGAKLLAIFTKTQHLFRTIYSKVCQESIYFSTQNIKAEIAGILTEFDEHWARFENMYIRELMKIENEARRHILKAIQLNTELRTLEVTAKIKGRVILFNDSYQKIRKQLAQTIALINSIANTEGIGRDDLDFEILLEAEGILRRVSREQSRGVRQLAEAIRSSFQKIRTLLIKYGENIEVVDPQLRNNAELVEVLGEYEKTWERGKTYFLDGKRCKHLIFFSHILETTAEKYGEFGERLEARDSEIFIQIPSLMILKNLDKDDKNICHYFLPQMFDNKSNVSKLHLTLKKEFDEWKGRHLGCYEYFNTIERKILRIEEKKKEEGGGKKEEGGKMEEGGSKKEEGGRKEETGGRREEGKKEEGKREELRREEGKREELRREEGRREEGKREEGKKDDGRREESGRGKEGKRKEERTRSEEGRKEEEKILESIIHKIKMLASELERSNPMEWNNFLEAALDNTYS